MTQNPLDEGGIFEISGGNLEYNLYAPAVYQIYSGHGVPKYTTGYFQHNLLVYRLKF